MRRLADHAEVQSNRLSPHFYFSFNFNIEFLFLFYNQQQSIVVVYGLTKDFNLIN